MPSPPMAGYDGPLEVQGPGDTDGFRPVCRGAGLPAVCSGYGIGPCLVQFRRDSGGGRDGQEARVRLRKVFPLHLPKESYAGILVNVPASMVQDQPMVIVGLGGNGQRMRVVKLSETSYSAGEKLPHTEPVLVGNADVPVIVWQMHKKYWGPNAAAPPPPPPPP